LARRRERHYRVSYQFEGNVAHRRLSVDAVTPDYRLEERLRQAAAFHETCLVSRACDVTLLHYELM
jgi:hypothetical protein